MTVCNTKNEKEKLRRRQRSIFKKLHEFKVLSGAKVALIIEKDGRQHVYLSTDHESWPPSRKQIVSYVL